MTPLLTLVTDLRSASMPLDRLALEAVDGGVDRVQIREPSLSAGGVRALVVEMIAAVGADRVAVNGHPDIAASLGTHLHLPERFASTRVEAASIRTLSRAVHGVDGLARLAGSVDHVIAGHVFDTASHPETQPLGLDGLSSIVRSSPVPVVAIGGLTPSTAALSVGAGAAGGAVISYVNSSKEPRRAARELRDAMERAMTEQTTAVRQVITLQVNGKLMELPAESNLDDFLAGRNLHPRLVVVERNGEIVAKSAYASTVLIDGDVLEIAHFVGGG